MANLLQKLFSGLTQSGITLPNGQFENERQAQNTVPELPDFIKDAGGMNAGAQPSSVQTPSFLQAMKSGPGGTPNAMSPALSTKGKILTTLLSGAFGALAGAGQRTVGGGFQAGAQLPWEQAQFRQNAQRGQLENEQLQQQMQYAPLLRMLGIQKSQAEIGKDSAQATKDTAEAASYPARQQLEAAQAEAANFKEDPNVGLIDLRTKQPVSDVGFVRLNADEASALGNKQAGDLVPLKVKNTASEIVNRGKATVNTEEGVFDYNRNSGSMKRLGSNPRMVFAPENRIIPAAADPNDPGNLTYMRAGQALKTGAQAPGSAPVAAAKSTLKSFTSGQYSQNLNAIDTARKHMATFKDLAQKLGNGDTRAFNSLGNAIGTQFGSDKVTNFNIAKQFFSGEVGKAVVAGGGTAGERDQLAESINNSGSWQQLSGAMKTADALLGGKQEALKNTFKSGMQAQPNFGGASGAPSGATHAVIVGGKVIGYTSDGKTMIPAQ